MIYWYSFDMTKYRTTTIQTFTRHEFNSMWILKSIRVLYHFTEPIGAIVTLKVSLKKNIVIKLKECF